MTVICTHCGERFSVQAVETAVCPVCGSISILPLEQGIEKVYEKATTELNAALENALQNEEPPLPAAEIHRMLSEARQLFQSTPGYLDADEKAALCEEKIAEQEQLIDEQLKSVIKRENHQNRRTVFMILSVFAAFIVTILVLFVFVPGVRYFRANHAMKQGRYREAYSRFVALESRMDVNDKRRELSLLLLANAKVGESVDFGHYDQTGQNGQKENIQWRVLARENSRLLLITSYALDCRAFDNKSSSWESSEIRAWLNRDFLTSFSEDEQAMILETTLSTDAEKAVTDRVFLLSVDEANQFLGNSDKEKVARPTTIAISKRIEIYDATGGSPWWLRTPGKDNRYQSIVRSNGEISTYGSPINCAVIGVRPAVWIDIG